MLSGDASLFGPGTASSSPHAEARETQRTGWCRCPVHTLHAVAPVSLRVTAGHGVFLLGSRRPDLIDCGSALVALLQPLWAPGSFQHPRQPPAWAPAAPSTPTAHDSPLYLLRVPTKHYLSPQPSLFMLFKNCKPLCFLEKPTCLLCFIFPAALNHHKANSTFHVFILFMVCFPPPAWQLHEGTGYHLFCSPLCLQNLEQHLVQIVAERIDEVNE